MGYVLIGTEASPFSGKARAYLKWKGVDFVERAAAPELHRRSSAPSLGSAVTPILLTPGGRAVQDTSNITDHVEAAHPSPSVYPAGAVQKLASLLLELYADEWLAIPATHYRWSSNEA